MTYSPLRFLARAALLLIAAASTSACTFIRSPVKPPFGSAFTSVGAPVDTTFDSTELSNSIQGTAKSHSMFGLFSWGDATVTTAARHSGMRVIEHVDSQMTWLLFGLYSEYEIIVTGH